MKPSLIRDILIFGKLFFAVAPFLNDSVLLADSTLSGSLNLEECFCAEDCRGISFRTEKIFTHNGLFRGEE
jgi:hypothetical protein